MIYLLDTCVISDFVKGEKGTLARVKSSSPQQLGISAVTVMEINYGLILNPQKAKKIRPLIEQLLAPITIIPMGVEESQSAAEIRAFLHQKETPIGAYDLLISNPDNCPQYELPKQNSSPPAPLLPLPERGDISQPTTMIPFI